MGMRHGNTFIASYEKYNVSSCAAQLAAIRDQPVSETGFDNHKLVHMMPPPSRGWVFLAIAHISVNSVL